MNKEVRDQIGAEYGERAPERRTAQRNGYRDPRRWDTRPRGGRIANPAVLAATAVNAQGQREVLGVDLGSAEDGAACTGFLRGLVGRGCCGVKLVISDAHHGLKQAIAAVLEGASWQRCRTTSCATCWPRSPVTPNPWLPRWSARSSLNRVHKTPGRSWDASWTSCGRAKTRQNPLNYSQ